MLDHSNTILVFAYIYYDAPTSWFLIKITKIGRTYLMHVCIYNKPLSLSLMRFALFDAGFWSFLVVNLLNSSWDPQSGPLWGYMFFSNNKSRVHARHFNQIISCTRIYIYSIEGVFYWCGWWREVVRTIPWNCMWIALTTDQSLIVLCGFIILGIRCLECIMWKYEQLIWSKRPPLQSEWAT
jgi:hypothetical protein